ncbi:hypothetical protein E2C01_098834 [Portunus trituberculatus]|uniref:Uncharacterized protein n=1 Tax=Portunus trituberculatus TaxID=210409 RepID=A0A5B7KDV8_PORTR|nr:hypothetical protein [Portunus trituberculatus]
MDKVVSIGSGRRPRVGLNLTTYHFFVPFVEWFKVTYTSLRYPGSRWLHQRCPNMGTTINKIACTTNGWN